MINKYTVVGFAPIDIDTICKQIREDIGTSHAQPLSDPANVILQDVAHFAIKRTFYLDDPGREAELAKELSAFRFAPVPIEIEKFGVFEKNSVYGNIVFAELRVSDAFRELHDQLVALCGQFGKAKNPEMEGAGWVSHFSVSYFVPDDKVKRALELAETLIGKAVFSLNEMTLFGTVSEERDERNVLARVRAQ